MSIERALTALEAIALALTAIAATHAPQTVTGLASVTEAKVSGSTPEAAAPQKRARPSKTEIAKATGIKVEDQDTALVVAKALVGKQEPETIKPDPEVMDYEVLKRAVLEVGSYSEAGRAAVISLLGDYGIKNAKDLQPELREEFHGILLGILTDLQNAEVNDEEAFA